MTALDREIDAAIASLDVPLASAKPFDPRQYIAAFEASAQDKARDVLQCLSQDERFSTKKPFLVSVGGGDGAEIDYLLQHSLATDGVLIEFMEPIARMARARSLPAGKSLEVVVKPAQTGIVDAMTRAIQAVRAGKAEAIVVTAHAVLHELFDRGVVGTEKFDFLGLFGNIFSEPDIPTWFTYREPGAPEKWPDQVLVAADCSGASLLKIANAIRNQHPSYAKLTPVPSVLGDGIRVHKTLGLEVLAKIFYLPDLRHEIEERITVIVHTDLHAALWTAVGDSPRIDNRGGIRTSSAPTMSFVKKWEMLKVRVSGISQAGATQPLAIAESQTRVIAWRIPPIPPAQPTPTMPYDIAMVEDALTRQEYSLVEELLLSRGRVWVEASDNSQGTKLLRRIVEKVSPTSLTGLWSRYLLSIQKLFSGNYSDVDFFEKSEGVDRTDLSTLFLAERMEFFRKLGRQAESLQLANELAKHLFEFQGSSSDLESYAVGTTGLLLSNFFRSGGRYEEADHFIKIAEKIFKPNIPSHSTELAHCFYAKQVCAAMMGVTSFQSPETETPPEFATGLIQLSYSHAAWSINNIASATKHAQQAAVVFREIQNGKYADRAKSLHSLLSIWHTLDQNQTPDYGEIPENLREGVAALISGKNLNYLVSWFPKLRPSLSIGLLQFAKSFSPALDEPLELPLPAVLERDSEVWRWGPASLTNSLRAADLLLRQQMGIPADLRIPLIAD